MSEKLPVDDGTPSNLLYRFEDFALDSDKRELRRDGALVAVEPEVFDLLVFLVANRDHVVSRDDLLDGVWGGRIVSESTLASRINAARRAIGDDGKEQRLIRTTIGRGLRFVGSICEPTYATEPPSVAPNAMTNAIAAAVPQVAEAGLSLPLRSPLTRLTAAAVA